MSQPKFSQTVYRFRAVLSGLLLLAIIYFAAFTWLTLPSFALVVGWHPDTQLTVLRVVEETYQDSVQPGDIVLSIDGQSVRRGSRIYPSSLQPTYEVILERDGQQITRQIVGERSHFFRIWIATQAGLALAIWIVGFMTTQFAQPTQMSTVYVGFGFQLIAAGIVSPGPSQYGAPGAWLVGHVLVFYFPFIMLCLSLLPRQLPLGGAARRLLKGSFYGLTGLALLAAVEAVWLFPERSLADYLSVRSSTLLTVVTGISIILSLIILLTRFSKSPPNSYMRQQLKLVFVFLTLAVTPLFLFVILPIDQTLIFAPFPFIYSFFLLAPAGYFFVFHRQGYLVLDAVFSRAVTITVLAIAVVMAYATGLYFLDALLGVPLNDITQGIYMLLLFGMAAGGQRPIQNYVDVLVYGQNLLDDEAVQEVTAKLSANPEPATVAAIMSDIGNRIQVEQTAVLTRQAVGYGVLVSSVSPFTAPAGCWEKDLCLRSRQADTLAGLPQWVELSLPIKAKGAVLGLLLLSRPANGYFNGRQVHILQEVADTMAFGLLVIDLVETMHHMSQQALHEKELQRHRIATEIHNEPLHALTALTMKLQVCDDGYFTVLQEVADTIHQVTSDLRRIISGLRPPILRESVEWITRQLVRQFEEIHQHVRVVLRLDITGQRQASETTKVAFYYILTEALNNISKHAQAKLVEIHLCYGEENLELLVCDDGEGPGMAMQPLAELLRNQQLGVADMHRWAAVGGGSLTIRPNQPTGTFVHLNLPLAEVSSVLAS